MKPVRVTKQFDKAFKKRIALKPELRTAYVASVTAFTTGKRGYPLNDHALKGKLKDKRAFSVANDVRVVYEETDDAYVFLDVGSHNQVYNLPDL